MNNPIFFSFVVTDRILKKFMLDDGSSLVKAAVHLLDPPKRQSPKSRKRKSYKSNQIRGNLQIWPPLFSFFASTIRGGPPTIRWLFVSRSTWQRSHHPLPSARSIRAISQSAQSLIKYDVWIGIYLVVGYPSR